MNVATWHTVGDSHALYAWPSLVVPGWQFVQHHLGPTLMHTFASGRAALVDITKLGVEEGDAVCWCFGEVDCRAHVAQHGLGGLAVGYFAAIEEQVSKYRRLHVVVFNIVPPQPVPHYAHIGTPQQRLRWVRLLNLQLAAGCRKVGWDFLNVYAEYAGVDGFLNPKLAGRKGHIGDVEPLQNAVQKLIAGWKEGA